MARDFRLTRIIQRTGEVAYELGNLQFSDFHPPAEWRPDLNAYRYDDRIEICVDLAGVEKQEIHVKVLPDSITIEGERPSPTPECREIGDCREVMAMEIESGPFRRELKLPGEVDHDRVTAKQENGLLWIVLPLTKGGADV